MVAAVAHRGRRGDLGEGQILAILRAIDVESPSVDALEIDDEIQAGARACLLRYDLGAGDAFQLASCLLVVRRYGRDVERVGYDARLAAAARTEGLTVLGAA